MIETNYDAEVHYRNDYSFKYEADIPAIIMTLYGYANSQQFREITEELLNQIILHRVSKVIADTTHMKIIAAEDQAWFLNSWLPRAIQADFKTCAMVKSNYFFNQKAIENIAKKMDKEIFTLALFDTFTQAKSWLKSLSNSRVY